MKRAFGPHAVVLGTRTVPGGPFGGMLGREWVEVTAGPADLASPAPRLRARPAPATPAVGDAARVTETRPAETEDPPRRAEEGVPPALREHYERLVQAEVTDELARQLIRDVSRQLAESERGNAQAVRAALRARVASLVPDEPALPAGAQTPVRIALVGPPGGGKTSTAAKLAALAKLREQRRVGLLSLDTQRPGAAAELSCYADVLEIPLVFAQTIAEVRAAEPRWKDVDVLVIDTPGVGLREQARFARLATLLRAARPDVRHLVVPACTTTTTLERCAAGFAPLGLSGLVLTRLDDVLGLGIILNAITRVQLRLSYITTGRDITRDLEPACGLRIARLLFGGEESS